MSPIKGVVISLAGSGVGQNVSEQLLIDPTLLLML
jgi:hypothetical protein